MIIHNKNNITSDEYKLDFIKNRNSFNGSITRLMYAMIAQTVTDLAKTSQKTCNKNIKKDTIKWLNTENGKKAIENICILSDISYKKVMKLIQFHIQ